MTFHITTGTYTFPTVTYTEDGPIDGWQEYFLIGCSDEAGHQWTHTGHYETLAEADAAVARGLIGDPRSQPDSWAPDDPIYGSDAWDDEAEYGLACFEADAFGEPRPIW